MSVQEVKTSDLAVGQKVRYQPDHYDGGHWENGIVKEIRPSRKDGVWVVYNCCGNWDRYMDYTGALTNVRDIKIGWR